MIRLQIILMKTYGLRQNTSPLRWSSFLRSLTTHNKRPNSDSEKLSRRFNFIANAAELTAPSVVYIEVHGNSHRFDSHHLSRKHQLISSGSGFLVTDYGVILTNAHVVNQSTSLKVWLRSKEVYGANIVDADPIADLAVLQLNGLNDKKLQAATLGNSASIRAGEWVVTLGSPHNLSNTVTAGIVSAVHRGGKDIGLRKDGMEYIQTDAAINRGNSGGPLINLDSEVIGINTMTLLNTTGISFAAPIDRAKAFLLQALEKQDLIKSGKLSNISKHRPYIGLKMMSLTPVIVQQLRHHFHPKFPDISHGILVVDVIHNSPAYQAGLQPYDIIVEADGVMLSSTENILNFVVRSREFDVNVVRGSTGEKISLRIKPKVVSNT